MQAFFTGSRVYGRSTLGSDLDVIVLCSQDEYLLFRMVCDPDSGKVTNETNGGLKSLKFGKLNVLCFTCEKEFYAWKHATDCLVDKRPVSRDTAIDTIDSMLLNVGIDRTTEYR